jgi:hypothetical protein
LGGCRAWRPVPLKPATAPALLEALVDVVLSPFDKK